MALRVVNGAVVEDGTPLKARFLVHSKRVAINKWEDVIHINLRTPGSRDSYSREATEQDKLDYPIAWEKFEAGESQDTGTPLTMLSECKTTFELELKARGLETIELLAECEEPPAEHLEPMWNQAKLFVEVQERFNGGERTEAIRETVG